MKRYEEIAELLAEEIRSGRMAHGTRLPSIRQLIAQHHISPATAFQAYYRLEERGLVRARERSGYFVAGSGAARAPEPSQRQPARISQQIDGYWM